MSSSGLRSEIIEKKVKIIGFLRILKFKMNWFAEPWNVNS